MAFTVLYFAWVRERIGIDEEEVDPPDGIATLGELIGWLAERGGAYAEALTDRSRLRGAIDQHFAALDAPITGAREIAIFPPVTGG